MNDRYMQIKQFLNWNEAIIHSWGIQKLYKQEDAVIMYHVAVVNNVSEL